MFVVRNVTDSITDSADMSTEQADAYNSPFLSYEGNIRGSRAKTLCNSVRGHNLAAKDDSEKIGVFTDDKGADYVAGQTAGTTTAEINNVNSAYNLEKLIQYHLEWIQIVDILQLYILLRLINR